MYINPFLAGILSTILVEMLALIIFSIISQSRKKK